MAIDQTDRPDRGLQRVRSFQQPRQLGDHAAGAVAQRRRIVAQHVEHPEHQRRAAQIFRHVAMYAPDKVDDGGHVFRFSYVFRLEGLALDKAQHQRPRLRVHHFRRHTGFMGGAAGGQFVEAHHLMQRDIAADTYDIFPTRVLDNEIYVGNAARQRPRIDLALPAGQTLDERLGRLAHIEALCSPSPRRRRIWPLPAAISRSAMMAMKATDRPAIMPRPVSALVSAI